MAPAFKPIQAALKPLYDLPAEMQKKTYSKGINRANRVVQQVMRKLIKTGKHERSGTLVKSIKTKLKRYNRAKTVVGFVGVQSHFQGTYYGKAITPHRYAHFVTRFRRSFMQEFPKNSGRFRRIGENTPDDFVEKTEASATDKAAKAVTGVIEDVIRTIR